MKTENLTFIEAVRELEAGRCEGIQRKGWANIIGDIIGRTGYYSFSSEYILATDWQLVGVKPEVETVEFVRWEVRNRIHKIYTIHSTDENCNSFSVLAEFKSEEDAKRFLENLQNNENDFICKVTGSYTKPVKQKVKREVEINATVFRGSLDCATDKLWNAIIQLPDETPIKLKLEWEEYSE